jgi:hypothetical protein
MQSFLKDNLLQKVLDVRMEFQKSEIKSLGVGMRIILKLNLKKYYMRMWRGLFWFRIETIDRLL